MERDCLEIVGPPALSGRGSFAQARDGPLNEGASVLPCHLVPFTWEGPRLGVQQQLLLALFGRDPIDPEIFKEVHTAFACRG